MYVSNVSTTGLGDLGLKARYARKAAAQGFAPGSAEYNLYAKKLRKKDKKKQKQKSFVGKLKKVAKIAIPVAAAVYAGPWAISVIKKGAGMVSGAFQRGATPSSAGQIAVDVVTSQAPSGTPQSEIQSMINESYNQGVQQSVASAPGAVDYPGGFNYPAAYPSRREDATAEPSSTMNWILPVIAGVGILLTALK